MRYILILVLLATVGCKKKMDKEKELTKGMEPQVVSLLGITYYEPLRDEKTQQKLEQNLKEAKKRFKANPSEENYIWLGRRMAYLSHYVHAIEIFSEGIEEYPDSYKLYRHRGHRYISIRDFDKAIDDLEKAASLMPKDTLEIEPDGIPNKINQPLSNTQFNVWYHLALAYYLNGDFNIANKLYDKCMKTSVNDDLVCATTDWKYMTLRRLGEKSQADSLLQLIDRDMQIIENESYHKRLLMYKGLMSPDSLLEVSSANPDPDLALATQGYGVGNWYLYNGDSTRAYDIFNKVIEGKHWSAFGFIAAEAELSRQD
ncbi:hypothetical protein E1176_09170 [Fulvivirga sp. RKSG066]|uniref:tetratricopeptide repeat protein n=1 Tax=Fulvivirga aurantia TaxID=2529383 RepID=UPI0012BD79B1|nr:hypothetical protein [Fulvivirga aurantia]MTI21188.1 hypothetical protein [Fulvivirga aurantia]